MTTARPVPVREGDIIAEKYRVERVLGAGAMGVVVAAEHLQLGRTVALKFLHPEACENEQAVSRFLREGQALARISSPHVAQVMDVGTLEHGEPYIVMEYLPGLDLGALLRQRGRLPISEAVNFLLQVCEAIAEAHAIGIVHRDLKPSNLFLTEGADGLPLVKVLDFGISKALVNAGEETAVSETCTGAIVGSPLYMSPEQIRNAKRVDARTDIWALGVILHEFLSGKPPFKGETPAGTLAAIAADPPIPLRSQCPEVPGALEAAVLRCLQKERSERYSTVAEFARAIGPFASAELRGSLSRIERLLSRAGSATSVDSEALRDPRTASASVPPWEERARSGSAANTSRRRRAVLVVTPLVVVAGLAVVVPLLSRATFAPKASASSPAATAVVPVVDAGESERAATGTAGPIVSAAAPPVVPPSSPAQVSSANGTTDVNPMTSPASASTPSRKAGPRRPAKSSVRSAAEDEAGTLDRK